MQHALISKAGFHFSFLLAAGLMTACGDTMETPVDAGVCTPGPVTLSVTSPSAFACQENFRATLSVDNGSCSVVTVQEIALTARVTAGRCTPATSATYTPQVAAVGASREATVLDLTAGPFCCTPPMCPTPFECDERFTFTVMTSAGTFTATTTARLNLSGCTVLCP